MTREDFNKQRREAIAKAYRNMAFALRNAGAHKAADEFDVAVAELERPRIGDAIAGMTSALGIKPCGDCKKRQAALNTVDTTKPTIDVIKDIFRALTSS